MKVNGLFACVLAIGLAGCTDHETHVAPQPQAGNAEAPAPKLMSMKPTSARIAGLTGTSADCNIESMNGQTFDPAVPTASAAETAEVTGWLIDSKQKIVPTNVLVRVESEAGDKAWEQPVTSWGDRGDIVNARGGVAAYQKSGFNVRLDLGELSPGAYNIYVVYGDEEQQTACGVGRRFSVK